MNDEATGVSELGVSSAVLGILRRYYLEEAEVDRLRSCFDTAVALANDHIEGDSPYIGQAVAHLARQSLSVLSSAAGDPEVGLWKDVTRRLLAARATLESLPPGPEPNPLRDEAILEYNRAFEELEKYKDETPSSHARGLTNLVFERTGASVVFPVSSEFGKVVGALADSAHSAADLASVLPLLSRARRPGVEVTVPVFGSFWSV